MTKRNLIIIHRGPEYERDFDEIAGKVNALDRGITVYHLPGNLRVELPESAWEHPTLTVALASPFRLTIKRGPILRCEVVQKLAQQEIFRSSGVASPPAVRFQFGVKLDPIIFGDLVVLKTIDLSQTSRGDSVFLFRRKRVEQLMPHLLPIGHPMRTTPQSFIVQRFIDSGLNPTNFRVLTFLGEPLYCQMNSIEEQRSAFTSSDEDIEATIVDTKGGTIKRALITDDCVSSLAKRVADLFPSHPLLGIDIIRDQVSRKLYVLEVNAGGNTWHFSSGYGSALRRQFGLQCGASESSADQLGRQYLIDHSNAFNVAAKALLSKVHSLGS